MLDVTLRAPLHFHAVESFALKSNRFIQQTNKDNAIILAMSVNVFMTRHMIILNPIIIGELLN